MVDYLEKIWEHADVLLEQMRRVERGLPGLTGGNGQESRDARGETGNVSRGMEMAYDAGKHVNYMENLVYKPGDRERNPAEMANAAADQRKEVEGEPGPVRRPEENGETEEGRRKDTPLAARLERLERAVSVSSGGVWSRDKAGSRRLEVPALAGPGTADIQAPGDPEGGWPGSRPASGGAPDWVEQADRAFRRDSRRYDGSFYLY